MKTLSLALTCISLSAVGATLRIDQGLTSQELAKVYHAPIGVEIVPEAWLRNLELSDSSEKLLRKLDRYGFRMPDLKEDTSGLPIGVTVSHNPQTQSLYGETSWIGVNCAACHTASLNLNGTPVIIEGGPSLLDLQSFELDLKKGLETTLARPEKFARFADRVQKSGEDRTKLKAFMAKYIRDFSQWTDRIHRLKDKDGSIVPFGPGRMDGFGGPADNLTCLLSPGIGDETLRRLVTDPRNCGNAQPPVSLPYIWGNAERQWLQTSGIVHSLIGRDFGAASGAFGRNWVIRDEKGELRYRSSVDLRADYDIQNYYSKLNSPSWSKLVAKRVVPAIDFKKARQGKEIYLQQCVSCHAIQPEFSPRNMYGNSYWKTPVFDQKEVGTDPEFLRVLTGRKAIVSPYFAEEMKKTFGSDSIDAEGRGNANDYRAVIITKMIKDQFKEKKMSVLEMLKLTRCRTNLTQNKIVYKSISLEGVLFTAPFLHNGSVPTMWDLLSPAKERPKRFAVGCQDYDLRKMGHNCEIGAPGTTVFETERYSNGNQGHEYGVTLSDFEKESLIEFMKTLENPKRAPKNPLCH